MKAKTLRPSPTALLNPRCDAIFKTLFTHNSDEGRLALKSFLEAVLEAKVSDLRLIPSETAIESEYDKQAIFDIACTLNDNEAANIEVQGINVGGSYDKRAEYYAAHLLNHFTPKGTSWPDVPKVFQISVLNFVYDNSTKKAFSVYNMRTSDCRELSNRTTIIFIELPKLTSENEDTEALTAAEKWAKFLLYADDETKQGFIKKLCSQEEGIMAAQGILSKISQDDINWAIETSREKWLGDQITMERWVSDARREAIKEGLKQGIQQGLEEGLEQGLEQGLQQGRQESQTIIAEKDARIKELEALLQSRT